MTIYAETPRLTEPLDERESYEQLTVNQLLESLRERFGQNWGCA